MGLKESLISKGQPGKSTPVKVDEETTVFVRAITARQLEQWQDWSAEQEKKPVALRSSYRAKLIALCVCDEKGAHVFSDADLAVLTDLSNDLIETLYQACRRANSMDKKAVEDAEKN